MVGEGFCLASALFPLLLLPVALWPPCHKAGWNENTYAKRCATGAVLEGSDVVFQTKIMNEHLICSLCMGYLRDAMAVTGEAWLLVRAAGACWFACCLSRVWARICMRLSLLIASILFAECLHTFCKPCIHQHFAEHLTCPTCEVHLGPIPSEKIRYVPTHARIQQATHASLLHAALLLPSALTSFRRPPSRARQIGPRHAEHCGQGVSTLCQGGDNSRKGIAARADDGGGGWQTEW